jgi:hypothetical protein
MTLLTETELMTYLKAGTNHIISRFPTSKSLSEDNSEYNNTSWSIATIFTEFRGKKGVVWTP